METKIKTIKKCILNLKTIENFKQFAKTIYEAQNNIFGSTIIYYDFDIDKLCCEALTGGTFIPNTMFITKLPQFIDFDEMSEEEYNVFVENVIEELEDMDNWVFYNEKGDKMLL